MDLYPFFDWLDTSMLADISKAYGGVFAVVQMFHLLGMSMLGGHGIGGRFTLTQCFTQRRTLRASY